MIKTGVGSAVRGACDAEAVREFVRTTYADIIANLDAALNKYTPEYIDAIVRCEKNMRKRENTEVKK